MLTKIGVGFNSGNISFCSRKAENSESKQSIVGNCNKVKSTARPSVSLFKAYYLGKTSFRGTPQSLPSRTINNAQDALKQWELLKFAKYSDATTDDLLPENKKIRLENYSFLDKLTSQKDKKVFVQAFRDFTGFPDLREISERIIGEFKRATHKVSDDMGRWYDGSNPAQILVSGHDRVCSVGHRMALPGSDLDKGYVIIRGFGSASAASDFVLCDKFKGHLWDEIDQRLLSVNHKDAFPNVHTESEIHKNLDEFSNVIDIGNNFNYFMNLRLTALDPIQGAHYNRLLAEALPDKDKERAKNFAYLIETIRDGEKNEFDYESFGSICDHMNHSQFSWCSNVGQLGALDRQAQYEGIKKNKVEQRVTLQSNFDSYDVDMQYDIVKNIIKGASGDHDPKYSNILGAPSVQRDKPFTPFDELMSIATRGESNDIGSRRMKINAILTGKIGYVFDGQREHCFYGRKFFES